MSAAMRAHAGVFMPRRALVVHVEKEMVRLGAREPP